MTVLQARGGDVVDFQPMSPEEMQRTMQFVLHQQAQFAVDFAKLTEKTDRIAEGTTRISDGLIGLTTIVGRLAAAQLRTDEELREQREQLKEQRDLLRGATEARLHRHRDVRAAPAG